MTDGPDVPFEDSMPKRTADNNDLFLLEDCCSYARTMIKKLQALDHPDNITTAIIGFMECVGTGLESDIALRMTKEESE